MIDFAICAHEKSSTLILQQPVVKVQRAAFRAPLAKQAADIACDTIEIVRNSHHVHIGPAQRTSGIRIVKEWVVTEIRQV